jgi:glycosyltransferase involved in cell wall biosynthesis
LYSGADCVVYLSRYEGFGLPVLEAMACGAPVVASCSTSIPEVSGDAALLVDPDDVEAAATAIRTVLTDQLFRRRMIEAGFRQSRKFSWSSSARQVLQTLHKLVEVRHV